MDFNQEMLDYITSEEAQQRSLEVFKDRHFSCFLYLQINQTIYCIFKDEQSSPFSILFAKHAGDLVRRYETNEKMFECLYNEFIEFKEPVANLQKFFKKMENQLSKRFIRSIALFLVDFK
jgi:hypothetical protein